MDKLGEPIKVDLTKTRERTEEEAKGAVETAKIVITMLKETFEKIKES
ncbi:hypothetical protein [Candidatus Hakubella thermalkaliphila]|nr:hypothetical protein [Candidatus Hakubella thermalkaliphila]